MEPKNNQDERAAFGPSEELTARSGEAQDSPEVEGHRAAFRGDGQDAEGEQRVALEPAERVSLRSAEAEDGPEVEGHRYLFGPDKG